MAILKEYHRPTTIPETIGLLRRSEVRLLPLAGGTRLIGEVETYTRRDVDGVVDLSGLGLAYIREEGDEIRIGATTSLSAVIAHPVAGAMAGGILRRTARYEGPINLRNVATLGGTVATAAADSELYAALLALDAVVVTHDGRAESTAPLVHRSVRAGQGLPLITEIRLPLAESCSGHARIARTPMDRPIVAAVAVVGSGVERVAMCGVSEQPVLYTGQSLTPPSDFKGSAQYRREMAAVMHKRALQEAKGA